MKLLIIDTDSVGLALACWALYAGHEVKMMSRKRADGSEVSDGKGVPGLEKVTPEDVFWKRGLLRWADLIVPTGNGYYLDWFEPYRKQGYPIFGPSKASAQLEIDRLHGMKMFEHYGLTCPTYIEFPNLDKAIQHVLQNPHPWVFKANGDEADKSTSLVTDYPEELIFSLLKWKKKGKRFKEIILQEKIEGIEIGVSRWFGPAGWIGPYNINFEHKKLMAGEVGVNTGETGSVLQYVKAEKLGDDVLTPLTDCLHELGHIGDVDMNCIVAKEGTPYVLEATCRLGWPAFNIQMACHKGDPLEWMCSIMAGGNQLEVDYRCAVGVLLAQPEFPYSKGSATHQEEIPILGFTDKLVQSRKLSPQEMRKGEVPSIEEDGKLTWNTGWCTAGDYLAIATGLGDGVEQAKKNAYQVIDKIHYPNKTYRNDIGDKVIKCLPKLHALGYAKGVHI